MGNKSILILTLIAFLGQSCFLSESHKVKYGYTVDINGDKLNISFIDSNSTINNIGYSRIKSDIIGTIVPNSWKATKYGDNTISIVDTLDSNKDNVVITVVEGFSEIQELIDYKKIQTDSMLLKLVNSSSSKSLYKKSIEIYRQKLTLEKADKTYEQECVYFALYERDGIMSTCLTTSYPNTYNKGPVLELVIGQLIKNIYNL